jgi:GDPmannose 4,6-dehydratase
MKRALITGINGMDGSHLADFLLKKDYVIFGLENNKSKNNRKNTKHIEDKINFIQGNLEDQDSLLSCIEISKPDEVYNLAALSFVGESWKTPEKTSNVTGLGALRILESLRHYDKNNNIKFYQASSSEIFGKISSKSANENTKFQPRSPYGVAKLYAHWITKNYREAYGMFNCSGILFNHESERRGLEFVTRKITNGVAKIYLGLENSITLGNLDSKRDWGYSPDYIEAMWLMLQHENPDDYVIATGKTHSIRQFLDCAFNEINVNNWEKYIKQDKSLMRPAEIHVPKGNIEKAKNVLGWKPKTMFEDLVKIMVKEDIKRLKEV